MSQGWIKLHRKLLDSRVFSNEGLLKVWVYCLCRANHEQNFVPIKTGKGNTEVEVNEGEFIYGRNSCSKDLRMNPSTLHKRMKKLESIGNITMQSNNHYSIVSICNWSTYQDSEKEKEQAKEQPSNRQGTGKEQPSNTDKNVKNVKNVKNESVNTSVDELSETEVHAKEVSEYLLDSIIHYDPSHRYASNPPSINSWIKDIDRAIRIDGRTVEQLGFIIEYIYRHNGRHSDFWAGNIESGNKLRKHFDKIKTQIQSERKNGRATKSEIDRNAELLGNTANSG